MFYDITDGIKPPFAILLPAFVALESVILIGELDIDDKRVGNLWVNILLILRKHCNLVVESRAIYFVISLIFEILKLMMGLYMQTSN